jgi:hypothetical protein
MTGSGAVLRDSFSVASHLDLSDWLSAARRMRSPLGPMIPNEFCFEFFVFCGLTSRKQLEFNGSDWTTCEGSGAAVSDAGLGTCMLTPRSFSGIGKAACALTPARKRLASIGR